jgi:rhamnosyltransferase
MSPPPVAIVIRSKNEEAYLRETLEAIDRQNYPSVVRRMHIDSGSTDGTCRVIELSKPDQFLQIRAQDYVPGRVLNQGMKLTDESWVVFLNADATPVGAHWLSNLMAAAMESSKSDKGVGAVFGRQVPRPDCRAVFAHDYERCFGPRRDSVHWPHFFSMVSSIVNRAAWLEQPFREDLQYAEDEEWSYRLKQNGWEVRYAEASVAMHSHNYTPAQARKRSYGDSFASSATSLTAPSDFGFVRSVLLAGAKDMVRDLRYCLRAGRLAQWPHAIAVRFAQRAGRRQGFLDGYKHYQRTKK